jgi:hypothetical protein
MTLPNSRWLAVHTLAFAFSLSHLMLDWGAGIIGGPIASTIAPVQALVLVVGSALYALWAAALVVAVQGSKRAMVAAMVLAAVGALGNGSSIVACPPPCGGAAPVGDVAHIGSLAFGVWAIYESWQALARASTRRNTTAQARAATAVQHQ